MYNIFFPVWLLWIFPPIILIVLLVNLAVDYFVIRRTLKNFDIDEPKILANKSVFSTWVFGFISDIIGALLLSVFIFLDSLEKYDLSALTEALVRNPFQNPLAVLIIMVAIIISGFAIYLFNKKIVFRNTKLTDDQVDILSKKLAFYTAPYFFLLPTQLFMTM